jgi:hypothetical protein
MLRFWQRWLWRVLFSGIWRRVVCWKSSDFSEGQSPPSSWSTETSVDFQRVRLRNIPEDGTLSRSWMCPTSFAVVWKALSGCVVPWVANLTKEKSRVFNKISGVWIFLPVVFCIYIRDSSVGIATGYRLDGRGVGVRVQAWARFFSSPRRRDRFWGLPGLLSIRTGGSFLGRKSCGAWSRSLIFTWYGSQEWWSYISTPPTSPWLSA